MPRNNRFQHQEYRSGRPTSTFHLLRSDPPSPAQLADQGKQAAAIGAWLREAGVVAIYLVHGTFVGADAMGFLREIARVWPTAGEVLRQLQKQAIDRVARNAGNFTQEYAEQMQAALQGDHLTPLPVKLFHWSSENHHIGRADGAVRLIDELASRCATSSAESPDHLKPDDRVLICAHSHGGNLLALLTNLLANDPTVNKKFFRAARPHYCWPGTDRVDFEVWPRVAELLADRAHPLHGIKLDIVTMGTPIRYGWDTEGCNHLLHLVNHRWGEATPEYAAQFPRNADDFLNATGGDIVQHFGIAGTNFAPPLWAWRAALADRALGRLLQAGIRRRDLLDRLRIGCRVHEDGTTLLVDYGASEGHIAQHLAGHAVYTSTQWMLFQLELIAEYCYGMKPVA